MSNHFLNIFYSCKTDTLYIVYFVPLLCNSRFRRINDKISCILCGRCSLFKIFPSGKYRKHCLSEISHIRIETLLELDWTWPELDVTQLFGN